MVKDYSVPLNESNGKIGRHLSGDSEESMDGDFMEDMDPMMARITDLKLVLGLTLAEIAQELKLDLSRVKREWLIIKKFMADKI